MYSPSEEIKSKLDIVDVIREYIQLKPVGVNFTALCPFHREKTPSFVVSPEKQIWHCFGCGRGGDIFTFVMEMEGISFVEALRILAPRAGVKLRRQDPKITSQRNKILDIMEATCRYYHKVLTEEKQAQAAREYLKRRQLTQETIETWRIGYSPDSWDDILIFLKGKGFRDEEIFAAGLSIKKEGTNRFYNRFRGRIMFPICDINGNVVAFSARVSPDKEAEEKLGKYINSPQTIVYDKSKILFGLDKAKMPIKREKLAIVVEGQMDVITAHQHGFRNVIASSGTALTQDQITLIKRYTNNIALAFDMDKAGELAAERGIREAMRAEMNIKVVEVPHGKDPDECIKNDPEEWRQAVGGAKQVMQYYLDKILSRLDLSQIEDRRRAVKIMLPIIGRLANKIEQDFWLKKLSENIGVEEYLLRETLANSQKKVQRVQQKSKEVKENFSRITREERLTDLLVAILFKFPSLINYALNNVSLEYVVGPSSSLYKKLIIYYNNTVDQFGQYDNNPNKLYLDFKEWLRLNTKKEAKDKANEEVNNLFFYLEKLSFLGDRDFYNYSLDDAKKELIDALRELKMIFLMKRKKEIEKLIAQLEKDNEEDEVDALLQELKLLNEEMDNT